MNNPPYESQGQRSLSGEKYLGHSIVGDRVLVNSDREKKKVRSRPGSIPARNQSFSTEKGKSRLRQHKNGIPAERVCH